MCYWNALWGSPLSNNLYLIIYLVFFQVVKVCDINMWTEIGANSCQLPSLKKNYWTNFAYLLLEYVFLTCVHVCLFVWVLVCMSIIHLSLEDSLPACLRQELCLWLWMSGWRGHECPGILLSLPFPHRSTGAIEWVLRTWTQVLYLLDRCSTCWAPCLAGN